MGGVGCGAEGTPNRSRSASESLVKVVVIAAALMLPFPLLLPRHHPQPRNLVYQAASGNNPPGRFPMHCQQPGEGTVLCARW